MADMKAIVKAALMTPGHGGRMGLPMILIAKPGTGKTTFANQIAKAWFETYALLIASLREPADFLGFPVPVESPVGPVMSYAAPNWCAKFVDCERGLIFLDEINTAPPAVQAALLRVVLDGVVGDFELPEGVRFLAAMNETEDAAGGWDLAPPLANRFGHLEWGSPTVDDWSAWLMGATDDSNIAASAEEVENEVFRQWPEAWAVARGTVAGYMRHRPEHLMQMPNAGDPQASKAWPSPRSWENATRALASSRIHGLDDATRDVFMASFVGDGVVTEFSNWLADSDLPEPADVLDGKVKFVHDKYRLDKTAAILASCSAMVISKSCENQEARVTIFWEILGDLIDVAADLVVSPAKALVKARLTKIPAARKSLAKVQGILAAADF